jgi:DNA polymerase III subunit gamma/tau
VSLALYRKYRPGTLDEVIGQDHVVEPLSRALDTDRVHHAYLFSGPRGCGKTSSARILARSLNCVNGPTSHPCGVCNSCVDLAPNGPGSIDVIEMDAATHGLVDDARDLREKAVYAPASSRYKIYIIDEAHQLGPGAANALLKLVEEPPPHLRFVFATTEPEKIIGTIRSRTHHYGFRLVPARTLALHLASICEQEGFTADPGALALISRAAGGSVRDALSIMGQLLAGSGPDGLTYEEAAAQLGVTDAALIDELVAAMADYDGATMFRLIDAVVETGHDPRRFVTDLLERLRDLLIVAQVPDAAESGLIDGPIDRLAELREQATRFGPGELSRHADLVNYGLSELKGATAPRLQLELLAARLVLPAADTGPRSLAARVEYLERAGVTSAAAVPSDVSAPTKASVSTEAPAPDHAPTRTPEPPTPAPSRTARSEPAPSEPAPSDPAQSEPARSEPAPSEATAPKAATPRGSGPPSPPGRISEIAPATRVPGTESSASSTQQRPEPPTEQRPESAADSPSGSASDAQQSPARSAASGAQPAAPASPSASSDVTIEQIRALWPTVLDEVKGKSKVIWMMLLPAHPVSIEGNILVASHKDVGTVKRYQQTNTHDETVAAVTASVIGVPLRIQLVTGDAPSANSAGGSAQTATSGSSRGADSATSGGADGGPTHAQASATGDHDGDDVADSVDVDEVAGIELLERELGGVKITEYDGG